MESNISSVSVTKMVDQLTAAFSACVEQNMPFSTLPSMMLWGAPGVGKSQGVRQLADSLTKRTGKRTVVTDVRLLLFDPVDLRGLPTANEDKTLAVWLRPKIFQMDESPDTINILVLDEISAAPPSVQAAAYQITLDRTVGEHALPENCIVIAAGNRVTDRSVAYAMPKALANRLCHLEIRTDPAAWHDWAVVRGLHPYVVGYLQYNPVALMRFETTASDTAFPTPRSWEMVSNILDTVSSDPDTVYPLLAGCIGIGAASALRDWATVCRSLPSMEDIFHGRQVPIPRSAEARLALRSMMAAYARSHPEKALIDCSIQFSCADFPLS